MTTLERRLFPFWYRKYVRNENTHELWRLVGLNATYDQYFNGYTKTMSFAVFMLNVHIRRFIAKLL